MDLVDVVVVLVSSVVAGVVNAMAGGGSLLTVGILTVVVGLPGLEANGTNRVGVLVQNIASVAGYRSEGVSGLGRAVPVLVPAVAGSLVGSLVISSLADETFEQIFGILMIPLLILSLRPPRAAGSDIAWRPLTTAAVFFAIGLYGGAFQAGVGLIIVVALARSGLDLINANAVKVVVIGALTAMAVPVFIVRGDVHWPSAVLLAVGFAAGGWMGARLAVRGGERLIRPVLIAAVAVLAGRMVGLY